ncbi:Guanine nucleotide exchange factor lte1 [Sporothrix epigloea]|uniref:Guanine nucleotide exchange factor lte1 n=1 Tax=Sporothrix epigloea TaxID=1892477 RepID=A0ABP0DVH3_9PEZI
MDYELVSDFFLTYRSFIDAGDLLCMLIARLRWAVARDDEAGMIVRVRTFVALRHWILNYFADDYVVDYDLRVLFCDLLNSFVEELKQDLRSRELQLKILTELKKCWRRSCAQFWDGPEFEDSLGAEAPIVQGGRVEKSGTKPKPAFWKQAALGQPSSEGNVDETNMFTQFRLPASSNPVASNTLSRSSTSGSQIDNVDSVLLGDQMASSQSQEVSLQDNTRRQESHMSITSLDVVSCSFPTKNVRQLQASPGRPIGAHPAGSPLACSTSGPIATTPRALTGKRVRPCDSQKVAGKSLQHERSKSLSDSLRERAPATEKPLRKGSDATISLQQPGSLVRGALFPPGQPFVDLVPPGTSGSISRQTTICQPSANTLYTQRVKASAMPSQGMRKLLDSVRRALSTKGQAVSPRYSGALNLSAVGPRITANRLPTTSTVPLAWPRQNGFRCPLRIDLLGAKIAEDFKVAVRESAKMDTAKKDGRTTRADLVETHDATDRQQPTENETTSADSDSLFLGWTPDRLDNLLSPMSDAAMTAESKDIVSVDGERVPDYPEMTGALAIPSSSSVSVDAFEGAFLSPATDPTPPATPPELAAGTPRRSSYTLGQQVVRPSLSMDPVPMFIPDTETLGDSSPVEPSDYPIADASIRHPSAILADGPCKAILNYGPEHFVNEALGELFHEGLHDDIAADKNILFRNSFGVTSPPPIHRPQPSWIQGHSRHRSSRSQKSHFSHLSHFSGQPHSRRRFASFASGAAPGTRTPSFDASTFADVLVDNIPEAHNSQIPRVLRRRPGGDLRAVTNVGDLNVGPIRRSRSVGSLTSYSESLRNSFARNHAPVSGDYNSFMPVEAASPRKNVETFSVGMLTSKKQPTRASQLSTHSSRPVMRPSFEAEAKKLAQIPDDVDDDGGVESALLKLEGRFERKSRLFSSTLLDDSVSSTAATRRGSALQSGPAASQFTAAERPTTDRKNNYRHRHFLNSDLPPSNHSTLSDTGKQSTINILDLEVNKSSSHSVVADEREMESKTNSVHTVAASPLFHPAPASYTLADEQPSLSEILGSNHHSLSLLEPILSDDGSSKRTAVKHWTNQSVFEDTNEDSEPIPTRPQDGLPHSVLYDVAEVVEPVAKNSDSASLPKSPQQGAGVSFLKEDSDDGSDLSSELSAEISDDADGTEIFGLGKLCRSSRSESGLSCLPTALVGGPEIERFYASTSTSQEQHPGNLVKVDSLHDKRLPSPPMTLEQALQMSPDTAKIPELHSSQLWDDNRLPPTPSPGGSGPGAFLFENAGAAEHSRENRQPTAVSAPATSDAMRIFSVHLPFVLAFDSEVLAQQFTLIEKDALHEIDWKELISMRWKTAGSGDQRSWVNFLRNSDARGVEVVIARFNIMVKWTVSEIILTQDLEERARCIIKFIHVAAHCRRYRNFATMSQIAIALTTNEVSRLTSAWALVPPSDRCTLRSLETLVSPTRNFYSLRSEMEAVDIDNANAGCIPFVGVYTHDLLFNAQRPSEIASSPTTAPLVNFERCRTAASIVKTLLRLIEASTNYAFQPVKGITERCLWISALTDDDIRKYSEAQK